MVAVTEVRSARMETSRLGDGHLETQERQNSILISTFKKGHRPTDSGVSCMTTISMVSEDRVDLEEEGKEVDEREEEEEGEGRRRRRRRRRRIIVLNNAIT